MKRILLITLITAGLRFGMSAQLIDTSSLLDYDLKPQVTAETQDAAYKAPASKFYGTWYTSDGKSYMTIKPDGSGIYVSLKDTYNGIRIIWQQNFRWKKENGLFRVKFIGEAKHTLSENDQTKYRELGRTERENLMNRFKSLDQNTRGSQPIENKILYISADNLILAEGYSGSWLVNKKYLDRLKKESSNKSVTLNSEQVKTPELNTSETATPVEIVETSSIVASSDTNEKRSAEEGVFTAVEQVAKFPGGITELNKWISQNIHYPVAAQQNGIQGRVVVQFIVEKDGTIGNATIFRGVDKDLDREALRMINKMPRWIPGKNNGVAVRSYYRLPIPFRLTN